MDAAHYPFPLRLTTSLAITHVTVITMDTERVLLDQTVVIENDRIIATGPTATIQSCFEHHTGIWRGHFKGGYDQKPGQSNLDKNLLQMVNEQIDDDEIRRAAPGSVELESTRPEPKACCINVRSLDYGSASAK